MENVNSIWLGLRKGILDPLILENSHSTIPPFDQTKCGWSRTLPDEHWSHDYWHDRRARWPLRHHHTHETKSFRRRTLLTIPELTNEMGVRINSYNTIEKILLSFHLSDPFCRKSIQLGINKLRTSNRTLETIFPIWGLCIKTRRSNLTNFKL